MATDGPRTSRPDRPETAGHGHSVREHQQFFTGDRQLFRSLDRWIDPDSHHVGPD